MRRGFPSAGGASSRSGARRAARRRPPSGRSTRASPRARRRAPPRSRAARAEHRREAAQQRRTASRLLGVRCRGGKSARALTSARSTKAKEAVEQLGRAAPTCRVPPPPMSQKSCEASALVEPRGDVAERPLARALQVLHERSLACQSRPATLCARCAPEIVPQHRGTRKLVLAARSAKLSWNSCRGCARDADGADTATGRAVGVCAARARRNARARGGGCAARALVARAGTVPRCGRRRRRRPASATPPPRPRSTRPSAGAAARPATAACLEKNADQLVPRDVERVRVAVVRGEPESKGASRPRHVVHGGPSPVPVLVSLRHGAFN